MTVWGDLSWHNYYYSYNFSARRGLDAEYKGGSSWLKAIASTKAPEHYTGSRNENDTVQELLSGSLWVKFNLRTVEVKKDSAVYAVELDFHDDFDFTGDYKTLADRGYDTSKDTRLKKMGLLFTIMGIDEFYWEYKKTLTVEVPYHCDHQTTAYHWSYDAPTMTLTPDGSEGFTVNNVERKTYSYKTTDAQGAEVMKDRIYYGLEETVALEHDRPWVMEWDWNVAKTLQMSTHTSSYCTDETIYFYSIYNIWLYYVEMIRLPEEEKNEDGSTSINHGHYVGVSLTDKFNYSTKYTYTYILENKVNSDGSNMIYVTVYNRDLDEVVFGPEPMDNHWVLYPKESGRTLLSENSDALSGRDIYINYVGNTSAGVSSTGGMDLRIYENGKDAENQSSFFAEYTEAVCTEGGGVKNTCADCGYSYMTEEVSALGHDFGEYRSDGNASCTADGTQTRTCARCGVKETVAAEGSALGHDYGEYVFDQNSNCTEDGTQTRVCTRCNVKETVAAPDTATGHSYQMTIVAPTCTEQGYTAYACHCGDRYQEDYVDAEGHIPVIDPAVPANCMSNGLTEGSHCGVCGYVIKEQTVVLSTQHQKDEGTVIKEATYDAPGTVMYQCIYCGEKSYVVLPQLERPEPTPAPVVNPFTDVRESDWFYRPVMWAVQSGVTGGKTATTFAPYEGCTRAQVVTFLWAANGKPAPKTMENPFTDIQATDWYYNAVLWAVEQGITTGISADKFGPDRICTRAQIATFLWAAQGKHAVNASSEFVDVADTDWYATPIIWAKENDVTGGIGNGKFGPNDTCTRAQVVTFLNKVYG